MHRIFRYAALAAAPVVAAAAGGRSESGVAAAPQEPLQLVQVQVYFRHGARTPISRPPPPVAEVEWPKELCTPALEEPKKLYLHSKEDFAKASDITTRVNRMGLLPGGCAFGALTNIGHGNAVALGEALKATYVDGRGFRVTADEIYVRATDFPRTIATAQGVTSAMLGEAAANVPVHVAHLDAEIFIAAWRKCDLLQAMYKAALSDMAKRQNVDPALQRVALKLGLVPHDLQVDVLMDIIASRLAHAKEVPHLDENDHKTIHNAMVGLTVDRFGPSEDCLALVAGPMFLHIGASLEAAVQARQAMPGPLSSRTPSAGPLSPAVTPASSLATSHTAPVISTPSIHKKGSATTTTTTTAINTPHSHTITFSRSLPPGFSLLTPPATAKMQLYAVHDTTLVPMLLGLDMFDLIWPRFCASLAFELYEDAHHQHFVRVLYNDCVQLFDGAEYCPLASFQQRLARYIPTDWKAACAIMQP